MVLELPKSRSRNLANSEIDGLLDDQEGRIPGSEAPLFEDPYSFALALFLAAVAGAALPLVRSWSERGLHALLSVSAGIFLGAVFLHFLPELAASSGGHDHGSHGGHGEMGPWAAALVGFLALFLIEKVWLAERAAVSESAGDPHRLLWVATFVGLSIHAVVTGLALSATLQADGDQVLFLLTFLVHKLTEGFSLATVMRLAGLSKTRSFAWLALFALATPIGMFFGGGLGQLGEGWNILTGFAGGTFLYVAACDLLPEVFHGQGKRLPKALMLLFGIGLSALSEIPIEATGAFIAEAARSSLAVFIEMAPFLLIGFAIAGFIHVGLKPEWITKWVARDNFKSVGIASILGAPLPLCSCSVIPVAVSMRKAGASKGATSAFLIATPETGVDSVTVTYGLFDPIMTIARPVGAILSALFAGSIVNLFVKRGWDIDPVPAAPATDVESCCSKTEEPPPPPSCCKTEDESEPEPHCAPEPKERGLLARAVHFSFIEMLDDLAGALLLGIFLSGILAVAIPAELFESPVANGFGGLLLMLVIGIPIYVCASASTPIAAVLVAKGLSPGAALVFLLASPATNLGSLLVLARSLGKRVMLISTLSLAVITLFFGWLLNVVYETLDITPFATIGDIHDHSQAGWFSLACAALLGGLLLRAVVVSLRRP